MKDRAARTRTVDWAVQTGITTATFPRLSPEELKRGCDWAYEAFYRWKAIVKAASAHDSAKHALKHVAYRAGWKKFEPEWDALIRIRQLSQMRPLLEAAMSPVAPTAADASGAPR